MDDATRDAFHTMADELVSRLSDPAWETWSEAELDRRARAAFRLQLDACAPYRAYCERRGVTPDSVGSWEEIPAVPATAFKYFDFDSSGGQGDGAVFRTSGTTRGAGTRGRHRVPRLDLYRASLLEPFRRALLPDLPAGAAIPFVSLVPPPSGALDSSLSYMVGAAAERMASETHWLVGAGGAWRGDAVERLVERVGELRAGAEPVLLLGTALSLAHLTDVAERARGAGGSMEAGRGRAAGATESALLAALSDMPEGSRAMETGGFKGARREVSRDELHAQLARTTGIGPDRIVSEYGMTELLSQLYEPVLTEGPGAAGLHVPPPWLRVRALDPTTLRPVPEGEEGILAFFDLANLGSVCHVLTEDVGAIEDGRLRLRGRSAGAEPRGCSRAMDELMSAAGRA